MAMPWKAEAHPSSWVTEQGSRGLGTEVCCVNRGERAEQDLPPPSGKIGKCTRSRPGVRQTCNDGGQLERAERALGGPGGGRWELGCVMGPQVGANDGGQLEWGEWALGDPKGGPFRASPGRRARVSQAFALPTSSKNRPRWLSVG